MSKQRIIQTPLPGTEKEYEAYYQADGKWNALIIDAGRKLLCFYIKELWQPEFAATIALPWATAAKVPEPIYYWLRFRGIVSGLMRCGYKGHCRRKVHVTEILEYDEVTKNDI